MCGRVDRWTAAGRQRWHGYGDSGDVSEGNRQQLAPLQGPLLVILLLLHCSPATNNMFSRCQNPSYQK